MYMFSFLQGTSAQQLDASFNTSAALEIFEVDFGDPNPELKRRGIFPAANRYNPLSELMDTDCWHHVIGLWSVCGYPPLPSSTLDTCSGPLNNNVKRMDIDKNFFGVDASA